MRYYTKAEYQLGALYLKGQAGGSMGTRTQSQIGLTCPHDVQSFRVHAPIAARTRLVDTTSVECLLSMTQATRFFGATSVECLLSMTLATRFIYSTSVDPLFLATLPPGCGTRRCDGGDMDPARGGPRQGGCSEQALDGRCISSSPSSLHLYDHAPVLARVLVTKHSTVVCRSTECASMSEHS